MRYGLSINGYKGAMANPQYHEPFCQRSIFGGILHRHTFLVIHTISIDQSTVSSSDNSQTQTPILQYEKKIIEGYIILVRLKDITAIV